MKQSRSCEVSVQTTARPEAAPPCPAETAPRTIEWVGGVDGFVRIIDQTLLPTQLAYRDLRTVEEVWEAIKSLRVRGAPAIGVAAAMGVVVGLQNESNLGQRLAQVCAYLAT